MYMLEVKLTSGATSSLRMFTGENAMKVDPHLSGVQLSIKGIVPWSNHTTPGLMCDRHLPAAASGWTWGSQDPTYQNHR